MELLALFTACFLSATIVPFSSDVVLFSALSMEFNVIQSIAVASIGNSLGSYTNYFIGKGVLRFGGEKNRGNKVKNWEVKIQKYGYWLGFISWVPFIGEVITIGLGIANVQFKYLAITIALGVTLRYIIVYLIYLGTLG